MSQLDFGGTARAEAPRIPAPPPAAGPRRGTADGRWIIWLLALAVGVGAGVAGYQFVPGVDGAFDYWLALLAG